MCMHVYVCVHTHVDVLIHAGVNANEGEKLVLVGIPFFIECKFLSGLEMH